MHAVIVDGDVSYPPTSGKRLRTLHLMQRLAQWHEVTYIGRCQAAGADGRAAAEYLRDHHINAILVDDPLPRKKGPAFYGRLALNLFSRQPYSVASHQSKKLAAVINGHAAAHKVDLWQFEWSAHLPLLTAASAGRRLLIAHNVDTLIWQRYFENARGFAKRWFLKRQWRAFERFERWAFHQADGVVAVSAEDAILVRDQFGQANVDVVDNGIDRGFFEEVTPDHQPGQILFLGALDWRPNQDAVALLLDKIFPEVLRAEPGARLMVVGRNPSAALAQRIGGLAHVELHADVPDVRPFLARSSVMTVPLRIGGGSRLKILEALACGLPVVSSRVGAEGLCLRAGEHYTEAEEDTMAAALVQTLRQPRAAQAQAQLARVHVLALYDWDNLASKLAGIWEKLVGSHGEKIAARASDRPF